MAEINNEINTDVSVDHLPDTVYDDERHVAITTMPDGVEVAWDYCGACARGLAVCTCSTGIDLPRSIIFIHDRTLEVLAEKNPPAMGSAQRHE